MRSDYRQLHSIENRNRGAAAAQVNISGPGCDYTLDDVANRATVITQRPFDPKVPCIELGFPEDPEDIDNPVNILGAVMEQNIPVVTNGDYESFRAAFNKRCNFVQLGDADDVDDKTYAEALRMISSLPDMFDLWDENPEDRERWLRKFDSRKRTRMEDAIVDLDDTDDYSLGKKELMVKREVLLKRDDPDWAPRVIYIGSDAFNACTGPAAMVTMERACELFHHDDHCVTFGGLRVQFAYKTNDVELSRFLTEMEGGFTYEGDFSRNDREQRSRVALIYDAWLKKLGLPEWYRNLLIAMEKFKVVSYEHEFSAVLKYQLPTGTTSTTPRNSLWNVTQTGINCVRQRVTGNGVFLGDDVLLRLWVRMSVPLWVNNVWDCKMVLVGAEVELEGEATLLSRRIATNVRVPCMIPKVGKALARFNVRACKNSAITDSQYMAGKALSYAYEFRHFPIFRSAFLARYEKEDHNFVDIQDLSWFTRTSGIATRDDLLAAIKSERVILSRDEENDFMVTTYDLFPDETKELLDKYVIGTEFVIVDEPMYANLFKDM
jgi:hypothetical protein